MLEFLKAKGKCILDKGHRSTILAQLVGLKITQIAVPFFMGLTTTIF